MSASGGSSKRSGRRIMCQMKTVAIANFENATVDSAWAKRWVSSQASPANWARAKMATATRAKVGLASRAEAAHHSTSRANTVPIKTRINRILKDRERIRDRYGSSDTALSAVIDPLQKTQRVEWALSIFFGS